MTEIEDKKITDEVKAVLDKHGKEFSYKIDFPVYRILPVEVQLAMEILDKHKMKIILAYKDKQKPKK